MSETNHAHPDLSLLVRQARELPAVPAEAVREYIEQEPEIIREVNEVMSSQPDIKKLLGGNDLRVMFDNHRNHAAFMGFIFKSGEYESLARQLPWVYRAYTAQGFLPEYFPRVLKAWMEAIRKNVSTHQKILNIYQWMISAHEHTLRASRSDPEYSPEIKEEWKEVQKEFQAHLLQGDARDTLDLAYKVVKDVQTLQAFMLQVIKPSMYHIGYLWEKGEISVAREHLASSVVSTVLSSLYAGTELPEPRKGHIVVAATSNEYHELGARILSILFETNQWRVSYLGANMPISDLVRFTLETEPDVLVLSVALVFNLENAGEIIKRIKEKNSYIKIILGGQACSQMIRTCGDMGADHTLSSAEKALDVVQTIWEEKKRNESE